jgi:hypothetical protein
MKWPDHVQVRGLLLLTAAAATSFGFASTAGAAAVGAGSILTSARTEIASQTGVHVVFTAHSGSTGITEKIVADVGVSSGSETISEGSADVVIRVTPSFVYVSGNASGLTTLFGMGSAAAKKLGSKWQSWKAGTDQYGELKADLTMGSVSALLPSAKGTKVRRTGTVDDLTWVTRATKTVPSFSNTLSIPAAGPALPTTKTATASGGTKISTQLSNWGKEVVVRPPPGDRTVPAKSR